MDVIAFETHSNNLNLSLKSSDTQDREMKAEKSEKEDNKQSQKKQWQFTDTPQEFLEQQPKSQRMEEMKSQIEQSSSAVQGTEESSTMLNKQNSEF
ncbi:hypothetical protein VB715_16490 [Crocosphaera sp. UHCC 0190]|uniref:hypothetical protein n=1 Tax=Crocosphaera sp. UHCC 0190 TaxID=3110246 RepID=UPI002B20E860|nr:hypothetical protein [Crocosphaera sp. UHCC 0190]MEA5511374.1 hypothetical protein [Crocosphaera sp. UHCC 0190]